MQSIGQTRIVQNGKSRNQVRSDDLVHIKQQIDRLMNPSMIYIDQFMNLSQKQNTLSQSLERLIVFLKQEIMISQLRILSTDKNRIQKLEYHFGSILDKYYGKHQCIWIEIDKQMNIKYIDSKSELNQQQKDKLIDISKQFYEQKVNDNQILYHLQNEDKMIIKKQISNLFKDYSEDVDIILSYDYKQNKQDQKHSKQDQKQNRLEQDIECLIIMIDQQFKEKYLVSKSKNQNQQRILDNLKNLYQNKKQNKTQNVMNHMIDVIQEIQKDIIQNLDLIIQNMIESQLQKYYQNDEIRVNVSYSLDKKQNMIQLDDGTQFVVNQSDINLDPIKNVIKQFYIQNIRNLNEQLISIKHFDLLKLIYPQQLIMIFDMKLQLFQIIHNEYDGLKSIIKSEINQNDLNVNGIFKDANSILMIIKQMESQDNQQLKQVQDDNLTITYQDFKNIYDQKLGYQITFQYGSFSSNASNNSYITDEVQIQKQNRFKQLVAATIIKAKKKHIYLEQFINIEQKIQQKDQKIKSRKSNIQIQDDFIKNLRDGVNRSNSDNSDSQYIQKIIKNQFSKIRDMKYDDWDFNTLSLTNKNESIECGFYYFQYFGFLSDLGINYNQFNNFLSKIYDKYSHNNNSFHNFYHALTVSQGVVHMIKQNVIQNYYDELGQFALILSALCHDTDHPGTNNTYQTATVSKIALKYNDMSPLEQHHLYESFKVIMSDDSNIFSNFEYNEFNQIRKIMIAGILATDMKQHFEIIKKFQNQIDQLEEGQTIKIQNEQQKDLMTGFLIHTCDFSGSAKMYSVSKQWSERISKEFYNQNLLEIQNNVPQSPHMVDLQIEQVMAKQEIGFLKFIVLPNWQLANQFYDSKLNGLVQNLQQNIDEWKQIVDSKQK